MIKAKVLKDFINGPDGRECKKGATALFEEDRAQHLADLGFVEIFEEDEEVPAEEVPAKKAPAKK